MSNLPGNPHAADAARYINEASSLHDWSLSERHVIAANSQALAVLALAYEQRTANLIAVMALGEIDASEWAPENFSAWQKVGDEVGERMGRDE